MNRVFFNEHTSFYTVLWTYANRGFLTRKNGNKELISGKVRIYSDRYRHSGVKTDFFMNEALKDVSCF